MYHMIYVIYLRHGDMYHMTPSQSVQCDVLLSCLAHSLKSWDSKDYFSTEERHVDKEMYVQD